MVMGMALKYVYLRCMTHQPLCQHTAPCIPHPDAVICHSCQQLQATSRSHAAHMQGQPMHIVHAHISKTAEMEETSRTCQEF